jgi:outer membrane protein OmpA-like peptidoglycan-associated protein
VFRLSIAQPCEVAWDDMRPSGGGRFCGHCAKPVHDLSQVSERRARAIVALFGSNGFCGRIAAGAAGAAVFAPERAGAAVLPFRAAAAVAVLAAASGCAEPGLLPPFVASAPPPQAPPALMIAADPVVPALAVAMDPDLDKDTVPNEIDKCPEIPGLPEKDGCLPTLVGLITTGEIRIMTTTPFAYGKALPTAGSEALLDEVAAVLAQHPEIQKVAVEGHSSTDEPGGARLAESRAKAIMAKLVKKGVAPTRLLARGYGDTRPIAPSTTRENREKNRRVEFHIETPEGGTTTSL